MPVIGILNERPHGPCLNTQVDLTVLRAVLKTFLRSLLEADSAMRADQTPRRRAIDALESLFADARKPKQALDSIDRNLEERDRAFLMELVYGVVRHRDCLDWMLSGFSPGRGAGIHDDSTI
jgi:hypothetical protein